MGRLVRSRRPATISQYGDRRVRRARLPHTADRRIALREESLRIERPARNGIGAALHRKGVWPGFARASRRARRRLRRHVRLLEEADPVQADTAAAELPILHVAAKHTSGDGLLEMKRWIIAVLAIVLAACSGSPGSIPVTQRSENSVLHAGGSSPISHVIIIIQENRTFDNMFHGFPGANTVNSAKGKDGKTYTLAPIPLEYKKLDPRHDHPQFLEDYDQGKDDGFNNEIVKYRMGSGCSDYLNHPSCWVFSNQQWVKQAIYSYVQPTDVQEYWTLRSEER